MTCFRFDRFLRRFDEGGHRWMSYYDPEAPEPTHRMVILFNPERRTVKRLCRNDAVIRDGHIRHQQALVDLGVRTMAAVALGIEYPEIEVEL